LEYRSSEILLDRSFRFSEHAKKEEAKKGGQGVAR
jgi:hypothetical protein